MFFFGFSVIFLLGCQFCSMGRRFSCHNYKSMPPTLQKVINAVAMKQFLLFIFFSFCLLFDDFASAAPNALQLSLVFLLCTLYFLLFCANNCGLLPNQSHLFVLLVLLAHVVFVALLSLLLALVFIGL